MIQFVAGLVSSIVGFFLWMLSPTHIQHTKCDTQNSIEYCYYQGDPESKQIIYFFHGFGNTSSNWSRNMVTADIESEWKKNKIKRPHVIALSFGKLWWYNKDSHHSKLTEFTGRIESEYKITGLKRVLYGDSMGAHNGLRWLMDGPRFFSKVAFICPALPLSFTLDPHRYDGFWPLNKLADLVISDHYAHTKLSNPLQDKQFWNEAAPLPPLHIMVAKEDRMGFYTGGVELMEMAKKLNPQNVSFEEQDVPHCQAKAKTLALFMAY